jgi:hypothetical protein
MIIYTKINKSYTKYASPTVTIIDCEQFDCPLRNNGKCIKLHLNRKCVYGTNNILKNTKFSKGEWSTALNTVFEENIKLQPYKGVMAIIGDYIYISSFNLNGIKNVIHNTFIHLDNWTLDTALKIIETNAKDITRFMSYLYTADRDMYNQIITSNDEYNVELNFTSRNAYIRTLKPDSIIKIRDVEWEWDGEFLHYADNNQPYTYDLPDGETEIKIKPTASETILITDNDWVYEETEFAD